MSHKRGVANPTRAVKRRKTDYGERANTQRKLADTTPPLTNRIDAQYQSTASALSVIVCEYCRSRGDKFSQQQLDTLPEADYVKTRDTIYRAGDMVEVIVRSKGRTARLEPAVIAEIGQSSVFLAWLFETEKNQARKRLLKGKIDPSHKLILSSHADTVPVDALAGLMSPDERKGACTDWVLHSNAAQAVRMTELHDGCFMRSLIEKVRARKPSEGPAAPSGVLDNTPSQQESNSPSALEREENKEQAGPLDQPAPQFEASASDSGFEALELEKQRKEEERKAKTRARTRAADDTRVEREANKMREEESKMKLPTLEARSTYSPRTTKLHTPGAPSSTVFQAAPSEWLSSVLILPDQLALPLEKDIAGGEGRRKSLFQRSAIMEALETNCFGEHIEHTEFTADDIYSLIPKSKNEQLPCLGDKIIDEYIAMLVKKACEKDGYIGADKGSKRFRPYGAITCFWWPSRNVLSQNSGLLSSVNDLFMPVCEERHWRLLVVSGKRKTIQYFDSLRYPSKDIVDKVRGWVKETLGDAYNQDDWKLIEEQHTPQQDNIVDCGVAVLLNARAIMMGLPLHSKLYSFERKVMLSVRYELAVDLLSSTVDLETLPSAIQTKKNSEGIDEIPTTENENAIQVVQTIHQSNPSESATEYAFDRSNFDENCSSYEKVNNNGSNGNRYGGADECKNRSLSTSSCGNGAKAKDNGGQDAATAAGVDSEELITTSEKENGKEAELSPKAPVLPTEDRPLLFGLSANEANENSGSDRKNQDNGVELDPWLSLHRPTCSTPGPSAFNATESNHEMRKTSFLSNQNDGATQQSEAQAQVQILDGFKKRNDCTTDSGDVETEKWLRDTISGENGVLGSPLPTMAKKDHTATRAKPPASASAYECDKGIIGQGENSLFESDFLLTSPGTDSTLRGEDQFTVGYGTDLMDKVNREDPPSIAYSNMLDRPATDTKTFDVGIEVQAGGSVSQGFTDTGAPRPALATGPATEIKDQHDRRYILGSNYGAFNLQQESLPHICLNLASERATRPLQRLKPKNTMNLGALSKPSRGLGRRLREHSPQSSLRPVRIRPTDLSLDNDHSGTREIAAEQQSTNLRSRAGAASARTHQGRNPFDGLDSHPATPRFSGNNVDLPLERASRRKGVSTIGISKPAGIPEKDWKKMSPYEKRRVWHVSEIQSEAFGQQAPEPCDQCKWRRDNSKNASSLEECRVYKDKENKVRQCAACINSRKSCSFVLQGSSVKVRRREAQLTAGVGRNTNDAPLKSQPQPSPWDAVVWVTFPDNYPFHESTTLFVHNSPKDLRKLDREVSLWFKKAPESGLGDSAVLRDEHGVCVHQGLVTMLAVQHGAKESFSVRLHEWGWLKGQLHDLQSPQNDNLLSTSSGGNDGSDKLLLSNSDGQLQSTVIFIHATTQKPPKIQLVYEDIRKLRLTRGARIRVYPNMREWRQDQEKIEDIQVLDEIARSSSRPEYSYRPITCFGGPCKLQDCDKTVLKRSHSEGNRHVKIIGENKKWKAIGKLTCTYQPHTPERRFRKHKKEDKEDQKDREDQKHQEERAAFGSRPHWFHQEYVSGLSRGEFRVFIRAKPNNEKDARGRGGEVIALAWTSWNDKRELHIVKADENHFGDSPGSKCGVLSKSDLKDFCLYVFEELRARKSPCYESLEVGVRLDVGVADSEGQKRFFVNEITRWYNAHYFSYTILAKPWTKICKAFAEAFSSQVHDGMSDMVD